MDTTLNTLMPAATIPQSSPVLERAKTTKVQAVDPDTGPAMLPDSKPFVAQVVAARLSGTDFPETLNEIAPPERTLRPYGVPMLPSDPKETIATQQLGLQSDPALPSASEPDDIETA